jgi:hypothetical protein
MARPERGERTALHHVGYARRLLRRVGQLRVPRDAQELIDRTDRHLWVAEARIATGRLIGGPSQC